MIHVFGEMHNDPLDIDRINNEIFKISPDVLLHELLYKDRCNTLFDINRRLAKCKEGDVCDPRINRDIYLLGKRIGCKLIGIDIDFLDNNLSLAKKFKIREAYMLTMINLSLNEFKGQNIAIVVGDTHLRTKHTTELGPPSRIYSELSQRNDVIIHRSISKMKEIE